MGKRVVLLGFVLIFMCLWTITVQAQSNPVISLINLTDTKGTNFSGMGAINNSNVTMDMNAQLPFLRLVFNVSGNSAISTRASEAYFSCGLFSNYSLGRLTSGRNADKGLSEGNCRNESSGFLCGLTVLYNITNNTNTRMDFFLPSGSWNLELRCRAQAQTAFTINQVAFLNSGSQKLTTTNITRVEAGDIVLMTSNAPSGDLTVNISHDEQFKSFESSDSGYFGGGFEGSSARTVQEYTVSASGRRYLTTGAPTYITAEFGQIYLTPDLRFGINNITVINTSGGIPGGVRINISEFFNASFGGSNANISGVFTLNVNGSFRPITFFDFNDPTSCTSTDPFCSRLNGTPYNVSDINFFFDAHENCHNGKDDDNDGQVDTSDTDCRYLPTFNGSTTIDTAPPRVILTNTYTYNDTAILYFVTDEPSNATINFYERDTRCTLLNKTIYDNNYEISGIPLSTFTSFHDINLDSGTLGYSLNPSTDYYYTLSLVDYLNTSGISDCKRFKTSTTSFNTGIQFNITFIADSSDTATYNWSTQAGVTATGSTFTGASPISPAPQYLTLNQTTTTTLNISNSAQGWYMEFRNISFLGNATINLTDGLQIGSGASFVGLNHTRWLEIAQKLKPKSIRLKLPNNGTLQKCDDEGTNCVTLATTNFRSVGDGLWELPLGIGFSTFKIQSGSSSSTDSTSSNGNSGSSTLFTQRNGLVALSQGSVLQFALGQELHQLRVVFIARDYVELEVRSEPILLKLKKNEQTSVDVTGDGVPDLTLKVVDIKGDSKPRIRSVKVALTMHTPPSTPSLSTGSMLDKQLLSHEEKEENNVEQPSPTLPTSQAAPPAPQRTTASQTTQQLTKTTEASTKSLTRPLISLISMSSVKSTIFTKEGMYTILGLLAGTMLLGYLMVIRKKPEEINK